MLYEFRGIRPEGRSLLEWKIKVMWVQRFFPGCDMKV